MPLWYTYGHYSRRKKGRRISGGINIMFATRRDFLKASGALIVSFTMPGITQPAAAAEATDTADGKPPLVPDQLDSWIAVLSDGSVTAYFGKMDMGQGVDTAVAQMVAEELDVAFDKVNIIMGDTALTCNQGGASGSTGIFLGGIALRNAAAEARLVLLERAAARLHVPTEDLRVDNGVVKAGEAEISYAKLIGDHYFHHRLGWNRQYGNFLTINGSARPKHYSDYTIVGKSYPQKTITSKVMGQDKFITDHQVQGMLHARVVRPANAGCSLVSIDESSIRDIGNARVVRDKDFIAVVADREWDAIQAAEKLKIEWSKACQPFPEMTDLFSYIRETKAIADGMPLNQGDIETAISMADRTIEAEYEWPFQSHASMGPACAVADVKKDRARFWTGSQKPHFSRDGCAIISGLPAESVRTTWLKGPGSYGRNDAGDAAQDAALLSRLTGRPVRVQYMRRDGTGWDPKGPAAVFRARAGIDKDNNVIAYHFSGKGFTRTHVAPWEGTPHETLAGQLTDWPVKPVPAFSSPSENYGFDNKRYSWETIPAFLDRASPLRTAHLRDPLGAEIHFASESFIDELALATQTDPVAFRLKYITSDRDKEVVRACAEKARWLAKPNPVRGEGDIMAGRGFSYTTRGGTIVAVIADVEVERDSGRIWCRKLTVAHDCGLIINPRGLKLTIEGNVLQSLSRTLFEEVRFDNNQVTSIDWLSYPILDITDAPEAVDIVLINRPELRPTGAGEPSTRTVPAAVANAIFDATGIRMRRVPITADRMKNAFNAGQA